MYYPGIYLNQEVLRRGDIDWVIFVKAKWFFSSVLQCSLNFAWFYPLHDFFSQSDIPVPTDFHWMVKSVTVWLIAVIFIPGLVLH